MEGEGSSLAGTTNWTGHPLTITSRVVPGPPSGVVAPGAAASPPIADQGQQWRSVVWPSSDALTVTPPRSTRRSRPVRPGWVSPVAASTMVTSPNLTRSPYPGTAQGTRDRHQTCPRG